MYPYGVFVICTLTLVSLISLIFSIRYKKQLTGMTGMIISMFIGMNGGMTAGIFLGTLYQGNLYISTLLGILLGALCGAISGVALGLLCSIEGFMSGLMGGMMGAMLGEMLHPNQSFILISIFLTLTISSLFLYKILPAPIKPPVHKSTHPVWFSPLLSFIFLSSYLLFGSQLGEKWIKQIKHPHEHTDHIHE